MSTVRITADNVPQGKKGEVVSVPYGVGQTLVAGKLAEYPPSLPVYAGKKRPAPTPPTVAGVSERYAADITRLNEKHARDLKDVRDEAKKAAKDAAEAHAAAVAKLTADLDAANALIAELNAKQPAKTDKTK